MQQITHAVKSCLNGRQRKKHFILCINAYMVRGEQWSAWMVHHKQSCGKQQNVIRCDDGSAFETCRSCFQWKYTYSSKNIKCFNIFYKSMKRRQGYTTGFSQLYIQQAGFKSHQTVFYLKICAWVFPKPITGALTWCVMRCFHNQTLLSVFTGKTGTSVQKYHAWQKPAASIACK